MSEENKPAVDTTPNFEWVKDSGYRSVYSNQTQFTSTAFDFSMTFGEIQEVVDNVSVKVEQKARVIMSPLHFKIFVAVCTQNLKGYEERFGPISIPAGSVSADMGGKAVTIAP